MAYYDLDALLDADKGLSICFILAITTANCILIYMKFQRGSLFYTPKSLILTSLAIGDIFLALFVLVIFARQVFESGYFTLSCSTFKAFNTYSNFLPHFVYGVGLVLLAGEFLQRHRTPQPTENTSSSLAKSIGYSACPWILALIIILPLTMADAYYNYLLFPCTFNPTVSRLKAMYVVSVILPAILAVVACIAVKFVKLSPLNQSSRPAAVSFNGPTQGVVITSQNTNVDNAPPQYPGGNNAVAVPYYTNTSIEGPPLYLNNGQPGSSQMTIASANDKPDPNHGGQIFSTPNVQYPVQQYPVQQYTVQQYPVQQFTGQQYPPTQYPVQYPVQYAPLQFPAQQYTTQSNVIITAPTNVVYQQNTTAPPNPDKEKLALLVAAIVYFICVIPRASYVIDIVPLSLDHASMDRITVTQHSLFWLSVARSLITPLIFILADRSGYK